MATWITKLDAAGAGVRVAVKDAIDVEGVPTTVGCRAIADDAAPAAADAPCLAGARAAGARIVGKANLHELCFGTSGINPWFGTPVNPLDAERIPGGSSSGSAVAVATDEADIGFGTDTGGSVRIPAACCGIVGLKTTFGRVPVAGVWPLSASLDTIGPLARDVAGAVEGMRLLEPSFTVAGGPARVVGRVRVGGVEGGIDDAVDRALAAGEFEVVDCELPGWAAAQRAVGPILIREAWDANRAIAEKRPEGIGPDTLERLRFGSTFTAEQVDAARVQQQAWKDELAAMFERVELLVLPTLICTPPLIGGDALLTHLTSAFNLSGTPALALPVARADSHMPASLQLVAPWDREDLLCSTAARVEAVAGRM